MQFCINLKNPLSIFHWVQAASTRDRDSSSCIIISMFTASWL